MPDIRHASRRTLAGRLFLSFPILIVLLLFVLISPRLKPIQLTETYQDTRVTYAANRQWVWLPGDCVDVEWTLENAASATFFPKVEPGIAEGHGVRSIFFLSRDYRPGPTVLEDARGGSTETFISGETVTRTESGCVDFTTEPKLRVYFHDGSSRSFKLGLDVIFLRPEIWLLVAVAVGSMFIAARLLHGPRPALFLQLSLCLSAAFLVFFGIALLHYPAFLQSNMLQVLVFFGLTTGTVLMTVYSVVRRDDFALRTRTPDAITVTAGTAIFWLWALSFGRSVPGQTLISEFFWLPFFGWAFLVGMGLLWWTHSRDTETLPTGNRSKRLRIFIALLCLVLSLVRDVVLVEDYGIRVAADSDEYVIEGRDFLLQEHVDRLPKRIYPYVLLNYATQAWENPLPLVMLQSAISAASVTLLAYVLSYKYLWLGAGVGLLLAFNLGLGMFNRTLLSESIFVSSHTLCFAILAWHIQRRDRVTNGELFLFGLLCGWTFLIRGTGLGLIVPVVALYAYTTRSWIKPIALLAGFAVFLLGVSNYNLWRYGHAGLIGPQDSTLASSLFSYHLFSPDNGPVSQEIDEHLRACMGYLDYDDVPRYRNNFIYGAFQPCLFTVMSEVDVASVTSSALRELALRRPFDLSRVLVEEAGITLAYPMHDFFYRFAYEQGNARQLDRRCRELYDSLCDQLPDYKPSVLGSALTVFNRALTYPSQLYLAVEQISSRSPAVILAAFIMLCGFLWVTTHEKLLVLWCTGFVFYQILTVSAAHVFIPRYGIILPPFLIVLSVLAIGMTVKRFASFRVTRFVVSSK